MQPNPDYNTMYTIYNDLTDTCVYVTEIKFNSIIFIILINKHSKIHQVTPTLKGITTPYAWIHIILHAFIFFHTNQAKKNTY